MKSSSLICHYATVWMRPIVSRVLFYIIYIFYRDVRTQKRHDSLWKKNVPYYIQVR